MSAPLLRLALRPERSEWAELTRRPTKDTADLSATVAQVIGEVRQRGDAALLDFEERFDRVRLEALEITPRELAQATGEIAPELLEAIRTAHANIARFHEAQRFAEVRLEVSPGVECWQRAVPIERVGIYVPGGTAPLFSTVLMLATPAKIAGCKEIVMCTPPTHNGRPHPAVLAAASVAGVSRVFALGGVQAIAAMAYGTESVPRVSKILGPGNQYVTAAKQIVSLRDCAIDMPAGPSEVEVVADAESNPAFVASDLLSQAEHGVDSQALLVTTDAAMASQVQEEVAKQLAVLPRREIAEQALSHSLIVVLGDDDEVMDFTNLYAPEHLIIHSANHMALAERVSNAGSVFLGPLTPESAGDYASGTNHTLPTNGYATAYSGVNLDTYQKKITFQRLSPEGVRNIGPTVERMAEAESLAAHQRAMEMRRLSTQQ